MKSQKRLQDPWKIYYFVLFIFASFTLLFSIHYLYARMEARDLKYNFSGNYVKMEKIDSEPIKWNQIILLDENECYCMISEYSDENYAGIYDPELLLAGEMDISGFTTARYFSLEDYQKRTKSGIYVDHSNTEYSDGLTEIVRQFSSYTSDQVEICMGRISPISDLHREELSAYVNLTSLKTMGQFIYLNAENKEDLLPVIDRLENNGYKVSTTRTIAFYLNAASYLREDKRANLLLISTVWLYLIVCVGNIFSFRQKRKEIRIHKTLGTGVLSTLIIYIKRNAVVYLSASVLSSLLYFIYCKFLFDNTSKQLLDVKIALGTMVFLTVTNLIITVLMVTFYYWKGAYIRNNYDEN